MNAVVLGAVLAAQAPAAPAPRFVTVAPQQEAPASRPVPASVPAQELEVGSQPRFEPPVDDATATQPGAAERANPWSFSYSAYGYFVPEDRNVLTQIVTADCDWLHLEARYNYEDLRTGSLFVGYNFSFGEELLLDITPMVGGVFGDTAGVAPGLEIAVSYEGFALYSESEYVFDSRDSSDNFFYSWSELTWSPADWVRFGVAVQRTKVYETDLDVQRGPMAAFAWKGFEIGAYVFNVGSDDQTVVVSATLEF